MIDQLCELSRESRPHFPHLFELARELESRLNEGDEQIVFAPQAVFIKNAQRRITHHNPAFFPSQMDLVGKRSVDFVPDGIKGISQLTDEFAFRCLQQVRVTHSSPFQTTPTEIVEVIKVPLLSDEGRVRGLLGIIAQLSSAQVVQNSVLTEIHPSAKMPLYMEIPHELWLEVHVAHAKLQELSARQKSVVAMISSGLKQEAISRRLNISRKTVEKHREAASRKLSAKNYAELIRLATLGQIIEPLEVVGEQSDVDEAVSGENCGVDE